MIVVISCLTAPNGPTVPALAVAAVEAAHAEVTVTAVGQVVTGTETRIIRAAPAVASTAGTLSKTLKLEAKSELILL